MNKSMNHSEVVENLDPLLLVYPNPTKNKISIKSSEEIYQIKLFDYTGILVLDKICNSLNEQLLLKLAPGVYLIQIETKNGGVICEKISVL